MADDWETVTKIGHSVRGGNSRETVVRRGQLNQALRTGSLVGSERKTTNNKIGVDGQRLAKVDRTDDVFGVESVPLQIKDAVRRERDLRGMTQQQLAEKCGKAVPLIRELENINTQTQPKQDVLEAVENALNIRLRGDASKIGQPKNLKRKEREDRERADRDKAERAVQAQIEARLAKKKAEEEPEKPQSVEPADDQPTDDQPAKTDGPADDQQADAGATVAKTRQAGKAKVGIAKAAKAA